MLLTTPGRTCPLQRKLNQNVLTNFLISVSTFNLLKCISVTNCTDSYVKAITQWQNVSDELCRGTGRYPDSDCKGWVAAGHCERNPGVMAIYCVSECCPMGPPATTMETTTTPSTTTTTTERITSVSIAGRHILGETSETNLNLINTL